MSDSRKNKIERFAKMHIDARQIACKSQEYMALEMGISKKTVQNWEKGISSPSFFQSLEWFRILNINPFPYYLDVLYPDKIAGVKASDSDEKIEEAFDSLIHNISINDKRALLYLYYGKHGSSPHSVIQFLLSHLHVPMSYRIIDACNICTSYKLAKELNLIVCPDNIQPDLSDFTESINKAVSACKDNLDRYSNLSEWKTSDINNEFSNEKHKGAD